MTKCCLTLVRPMRVAIPLLVTFSVACAFADRQEETNVWQPPSGLKQLPIWPGPAPDASTFTGPETLKTNTKDLVAGRPWLVVENVYQPTITVFPPKGKNTGAAAVVFPGGGYWLLAMDLEGTEVCDWLTSKGITAILLKYRVPGEDKPPRSGCYLPDTTDQSHAPEATRPQIRFRPGSRPDPGHILA